MRFVQCDDAVRPDLADTVENMLLSPEFPWHYFANVNHHAPPPQDVPGVFGKDPRFEDSFGFSRLLFPGDDATSGWLKCAVQLFQQFVSRQGITPQQIFRIKANLLTRSATPGGPKPFTPHVDLPRPHWVAIYYVNDSDGDTVILDKTHPDWQNAEVSHAVSPKKGRFILFDGRHYHSGTSPARHDVRVVLNYDFL